MYDDWADIDLSWGQNSVLDRLSPSVSRTVAVAVVDDLARQVAGHSCPLTNDTEVQWSMQILCYGLGLPFSSDYITVRNVVKIYCEWLTCLVEQPSVAVPRPLLEQPSKYAREIINHLHHLFVPRSETGSDVILRQAKECHYVLRCLQTVVIRCKHEVKDAIWPEILRFLLSVNDALLSPPYEPDDISDQLCARTLSVLFELWISACFNGQFPSPSYWKTFRSLCHNWRHRIPLIDQWARACFVLTSTQLKILYGPNYCKLKLVPEDQNLIPADADPKVVAQTWFRILHLIGSPADVLNSHNFDNSPRFREYIGLRSAETGILDPSQHPCLHHLPYCFFRASSCVNSLVTCFLGEYVDYLSRSTVDPSSIQSQQSSSQVPFRRTGNPPKPKEIRSQSVYIGKPSVPPPPPTPTVTPDSVLIMNTLKGSPAKYRLNIAYSSSKPCVDSLLRLFGDWLFSSAAVKLVDQKKPIQDDTWSQKSIGSQHSAPETIETGSITTISKSSSQSELTRLSSDNLGYISGLQAGKAEAAAALCKIFCSRAVSERISENQVGKFCAVLLDVLSHDDPVVHAAVIFHGVNIFRAGLKGVELLVPCFLDCLDHFITDTDRVRSHPSIADVELRRACLDLLASIIVYPTHYGTSAFSDINRNTEQHTFIGFRARMLRILLNSLKLETDSHNIQMVLGLLCIFYQSCCHYERNAGTLQNMNYIREMLRAILALLSDSLCGKWSSEYGVCLSALDCFVALSHVGECQQFSYDMSVFDRVVISICRFIEIQLSRPPPAHSRDLHSTVVAAYACLECWIVAFPSILQDELCLSHVTDTIQLGVTGTKPQSKELDATDTKKPASQRVHDAAEQLLHTMFCRAGSPFSIDDPMEDESFILNTLGLEPISTEPTMMTRFLYALLDNTSLISLMEAERTNEKGEKVPAAAVVIRSPYAAVSSWLFRLETHPKGKAPGRGSVSRQEGIELARPKYQLPICIPPDVDKFGKCKPDTSFPQLRLTAEAERMKVYMEQVGKQQKWLNLKQDPKYSRLDAKPPTRDGVVHTARLLLEDLGYLDFTSTEDRFRLMNSIQPDGTLNSNFVDDLKSIDRCPARFIHTAHLFYVENGKLNVNEILSNGVHLENTAACFRRFLATLGVAIDVGKDRVWTGHWRTAYLDDGNLNSSDSHTIDGMTHALYWASPLAEISFIMPSSASMMAKQSPAVSEKGIGDQMEPHSARQSAPPSSDSELGKTKSTVTTTKLRKTQIYQDYRFMIVWVEKFEDHSSVPLDELAELTDTGESGQSVDCHRYVVFVCPYENGLYRIKLSIHWSKLGCPSPLVDGIVVSEDVLSVAIRQTILSVGARRRLEQEGYMAPFVKRRQKIHEFSSKYAVHASPAEVFHSILMR